MICLNCDSEDFFPDKRVIKQEYKGLSLEVETPVVVCKKCGWITVGNNQINDLLANTRKEYERLSKTNC